MNTYNFSVGYIESIDSVVAVETLFDSKGETVKSIAVKMSSKNHKNVTVIIQRKEVKSLITRLQKLL